MKTLFLHGFLKEKYGAEFSLEVETPAEAVRALCVQLKGFADDIRAGSWHFIRGRLDKKAEMDEEKLLLGLGAEQELHLLPALQGAGDGLVQVIVGIALIAVAVFVPGIGTAFAAAMIGAGAGLAVGGIVSMTMKLPGGDPLSQESAADRPSFLFNGPTNTSSQGVAVPRGYGRLKVGSIVVSAGLYAEEFTQ